MFNKHYYCLWQVTFLILRLKIRKFVKQMLLISSDEMYLGCEELAFPKHKTDPRNLYEASLRIFSATLLHPPNITFCLESGLSTKKLL